MNAWAGNGREVRGREKKRRGSRRDPCRSINILTKKNNECGSAKGSGKKEVRRARGREIINKESGRIAINRTDECDQRKKGKGTRGRKQVLKLCKHNQG